MVPRKTRRVQFSRRTVSVCLRARGLQGVLPPALLGFSKTLRTHWRAFPTAAQGLTAARRGGMAGTGEGLKPAGEQGGSGARRGTHLSSSPPANLGGGRGGDPVAPGPALAGRPGRRGPRSCWVPGRWTAAAVGAGREPQRRVGASHRL